MCSCPTHPGSQVAKRGLGSIHGVLGGLKAVLWSAGSGSWQASWQGGRCGGRGQRRGLARADAEQALVPASACSHCHNTYLLTHWDACTHLHQVACGAGKSSVNITQSRASGADGRIDGSVGLVNDRVCSGGGLVDCSVNSSVDVVHRGGGGVSVSVGLAWLKQQLDSGLHGAQGGRRAGRAGGENGGHRARGKTGAGRGLLGEGQPRSR